MEFVKWNVELHLTGYTQAHLCLLHHLFSKQDKAGVTEVLEVMVCLLLLCLPPNPLIPGMISHPISNAFRFIAQNIEAWLLAGDDARSELGNAYICGFCVLIWQAACGWGT